MHRNVLNYLQETVRMVPDKTAFSNGTDSLTFAQVDHLRRAAGSAIAAQGIRRAPVVVFMRKAPREVAAFFAVITAGCFYVPIDEEMPAARIQLILDNVRAPLVICDPDTLPLTEGFDLRGGRAVLFDDLAQAPILEETLEEIRCRALDIDPIYIVFTSGSTGIPKGVVACHRSVLDYVEQLSEVLNFGPDTVFGNQTPLYFDACLKEIYPTLKFGATTYLIPRELFSIPTALVHYLNEHRINTICWVVSALTMISAFDTFSVEIPHTLHTIAFGSEVFPIRQFRLWREALPDAVFTNLYGPTEATGMCCWYRVDRDFQEGESIPIGRPFDNREILLLTENNTLAEDGQEGEICVRGNAVTLGYYNDPERTAQAFVQNPLNTAYPEIIYRTGDIGRRNERGELVFVSRRDYQIKHMGHRVELGEVEVSAGMVPGVRMAAAVYDHVRSRIVLCYVGELTERDLTAALRTRLPRYMMPNRTLRMEQLPFTANGKIDRVSLTRDCQTKTGPGRERK